MTPEEYGDLVTGTKINAVDLKELFNEDWIAIDDTLSPDTVNINGKVLNVEESEQRPYHYHRSPLDFFRSICYNTNCDEPQQGQRF